MLFARCCSSSSSADCMGPAAAHMALLLPLLPLPVVQAHHTPCVKAKGSPCCPLLLQTHYYYKLQLQHTGSPLTLVAC